MVKKLKQENNCLLDSLLPEASVARIETECEIRQSHGERLT